MTTGAQEKIPGLDYDYGGLWFNAQHIDIGCVGNGVADDTTAINAAIVMINSLGGGTLFFPRGTYLVSRVLMLDNVTIRGLGRVSILKQKASSANKAVIELTSTSTIQCYIIDLTIDGNKGNQSTANHGIDLNNTAVSGDPQHRVDGVIVHDCKGSGIVLNTGARGTRVINCTSYHNDGRGIEYPDGGATDCFLISSTAYQNGLSGIRPGYDWFVSNCQSFGNGILATPDDGAGFLLDCELTTIVNCMAQENAERGFSFIAGGGLSRRNTLAGCIADSNAGSSFYFEDASDNSLVGCAAGDTPALSQHPTHAVEFVPSAANNFVQCLTYGSFIGTVFEFNGEGDNVAEDTMDRYFRYSSVGIGTAGGDEHFKWRQPGAPAIGLEEFLLKSEIVGGHTETREESYDGTTDLQYVRKVPAGTTGSMFLGQDGKVWPIFPYFTDANRGLATVKGKVIYNTDHDKLQCSNGSTWNDLF